MHTEPCCDDSFSMTTMDAEQRFLEARQARLISSNNSAIATPRNDEFSVFWSELRRRLKEWMDRLESTVPSSSSSSDDRGGSLFQALQERKEELQALRQHCLHAGGGGSRRSMDLLSSFPVPTTEFPNADLRLLHAEFTRCTTHWEEKYEALFPKGKFTFRRYRQELARRKILGIPLEEARSTAVLTGSSSRVFTEKRDAETSSSKERDDNGTVQNISNSTIHILQDGTVQISQRNELPVAVVNRNGNDSSSRSTPQRITSAAVLVRNVQNCTIQIDKDLEALHIVDMVHVKMEISGPIASAIHITNCHKCELKAPSAQQLRIHESTGLRVQVPFIVGAILEESKDIVFVVGGGRNNIDVDVKDFNWLRTGIPSPNFRIEIPSEETRRKEFERIPTTPIHCDTNLPIFQSEMTTTVASHSPSVNDLAISDIVIGEGTVEISSPEEPDSDDEL